MLTFDHVIVVTPDVDATVRDLYTQHGLASSTGGRHAGLGTANRIVPLGPDYLELMYVDDPAVAMQSRLGRWVLDRRDRGPHAAALMVRVDGLDPFAQRLGLTPLDIHRTRGDGVELSWRLAGLEVALSDEPLPVFVECGMAPENHPGRDHAEHLVEPRGISWVEFGGDPEQLGTWLGRHSLDIRAVDGHPGPRRFAVASTGGEIVLDL